MQKIFNHTTNLALKKLSSLLSIKKLSFNERFSLAYLCKLAGYDDDWRKTVEQVASENPKSFSHLFSDNSNRIYLPFKRTYDLTNGDKDIIQYIREHLDLDLDDNDYIDGYAKDIGGRRVRIGKVFSDKKVLLEKRVDSLSKYLNDGFIDKHVTDAFELGKRLNRIPSEKWAKDFIKNYIDNLNAKLSDLITQYNGYVSSITRGSKKARNLLVAISQDPHDIAQASYERAWDSCWNLDEGDYASCTIEEVRSGGLIAYVIDEDDIDIKKPYARVLMRKFVDKSGNIIIMPEHTIYGQHFSRLIQFLHKFANENINLNAPHGRYTMYGGGHSDTYAGTHVRLPESPSHDWIFKLLNDHLRTRMYSYTGSYFDIIKHDYNTLFKMYHVPLSIDKNLSNYEKEQLFNCKNKRDVIRTIHNLFPILQGFIPTPPSHEKRYGKPFSIDDYNTMSDDDIEYIWNELMTTKSVDELKERLILTSYIDDIASDYKLLAREIDLLSAKIMASWKEIFTEEVILKFFYNRISDVERLIMTTNNSEQLMSCLQTKRLEFAKSAVQDKNYGEINGSVIGNLKNIAINNIFTKLPKEISEPYIDALFQEFLLDTSGLSFTILDSMLLFYLQKSCNK